MDRKEPALLFDLAEASFRSDWLVEAMMTSRSPILMVSGPVWGEKTHNLNRDKVREMQKLAGQMTTYVKMHIKFDSDQARSHCLTNGPTMLFPQGPPDSDGLGEYTGGIEGKFKCL